MAKQSQCLFCGSTVSVTDLRAGGTPVCRYNCDCCPPYVVISPEQTYFDSLPYSEKETQVRIRSLIRERQLTTPKYGVEEHAFLQFESKKYPDIPDTYAAYVPDLLDRWPGSVALRLERSLVNLAKLHPGAGEWFTVSGIPYACAFFFAANDDEWVYYLQSVHGLGWIETKPDETVQDEIRITPRGWNKIEELRVGRSSPDKPVFVAMWFGGTKQELAMTKLYEEAIKPAVKQCGYEAVRSGIPEHNDYIMDRVRAVIRSAPFVVADLTDTDCGGVYYEAGLASGRGTTVIHCCPKGKVSKVHFDLKQRNMVLYDGHEDLILRLVSRIQAEFEPGPFPVT